MASLPYATAGTKPAVTTNKVTIMAIILFINYAKKERMKLIIAEKNEIIAERTDAKIPPLI